MDIIRCLFFIILSLAAVAAKQNDEKFKSLHKEMAFLREIVDSLSYTVEQQNKKIAQVELKSKIQEKFIKILTGKIDQQGGFIKNLLDRLRENEIRIQYLEDTLNTRDEETTKQANVAFKNNSMDHSQFYNDTTLPKQNVADKNVASIEDDKTKLVQRRPSMKRVIMEKSENSRKGRLLVPTTIQPVQNHVVAFYAYLSKILSHPGGLQSIVYDTIVTNAGNGYHHGVFIPPISGYYVFSWSTYQVNDAGHAAELVCNDRVLGSIHSVTHSGDAVLSTKTVVAHVSAGDDVYVRTHSACGSNQGDIFSHVCAQPSFSGWLLH